MLYKYKNNFIELHLKIILQIKKKKEWNESIQSPKTNTNIT